MESPPWKERTPQGKSRAQEHRLSQLPGGRRQPASGRLWNRRRDGVLDDFLIEARTTDKDSYTINGREWRKIKRDAQATPPGLRPAMQIDIPGLRLFLTDFDDHLAQKAHTAYLEERLEECQQHRPEPNA